MRYAGSCHCGRVAYEADVSPEHVVVCHCTDCQALSGTAFRVVVATAPGSFRWSAANWRFTSRPGRAEILASRHFAENVGAQSILRRRGRSLRWFRCERERLRSARN